MQAVGKVCTADGCVCVTIIWLMTAASGQENSPRGVWGVDGGEQCRPKSWGSAYHSYPPPAKAQRSICLSVMKTSAPTIRQAYM